VKAKQGPFFRLDAAREVKLQKHHGKGVNQAKEYPKEHAAAKGVNFRNAKTVRWCPNCTGQYLLSCSGAASKCFLPDVPQVAAINRLETKPKSDTHEYICHIAVYSSVVYTGLGQGLNTQKIKQRRMKATTKASHIVLKAKGGEEMYLHTRCVAVFFIGWWEKRFRTSCLSNCSFAWNEARDIVGSA
jgi:hypothetical protein